jgi:hypothetical protein
VDRGGHRLRRAVPAATHLLVPAAAAAPPAPSADDVERLMREMAAPRGQ